jgi:hypothetical protein
MSVESKIKELLSGKGKQELTEESTENLAAGGMADTGSKAASNAKKDTSKAGQAATAGDTTQPKQGSSQEASFTTSDENDSNLGSKNASSVSKAPAPQTKGDAKSVKIPNMEEKQEQDNVISDADISAQLNNIFGEELSEDFKAKATSIFEAAVIARVNHEMERVTAKLEESNAAQLKEYTESLVEKVDSYLNYVVECWMEENALAVESGLRTEIAEDFISGMKELFKEHYIDIPEEKYDVLADLQAHNDELANKLDEAIKTIVETSKELNAVKKASVFEEQTKNLTNTESEKFKKLVEGIDFDSEDLYREKLEVIKENYFRAPTSKSPEQVLVEETAVNNTGSFETNTTVDQYVKHLTRAIKTR